MKILVLASASVLAFATPAMAQQYNNVSYVEQIGNFNDATVYQANDDQHSFVRQTGSNDTALVEMNGENNSSRVLQSATEFVGGGNLSENRMSGQGDKNFVSQSGSNNISYTTFDPASRSSVSAIRQDGAKNYADVTNIGSDNISLVSQLFDRNSVTVFQAGENNFSAVNQNGLANTAVITQW